MKGCFVLNPASRTTGTDCPNRAVFAVAVSQSLRDDSLGSQHRLTEDYPYLIRDARYARVREDGGIQSQAVLLAAERLLPDHGRREGAPTGAAGRWIASGAVRATDGGMP